MTGAADGRRPASAKRTAARAPIASAFVRCWGRGSGASRTRACRSENAVVVRLGARVIAVGLKLQPTPCSSKNWPVAPTTATSATILEGRRSSYLVILRFGLIAVADKKPLVDTEVVERVPQAFGRTVLRPTVARPPPRRCPSLIICPSTMESISSTSLMSSMMAVGALAHLLPHPLLHIVRGRERREIGTRVDPSDSSHGFQSIWSVNRPKTWRRS